MKEEFVSTNFRPASLELISTCNEIIEDYLGQDLKLTLRQLYYQLVTRNVVPNTERSYKNIGSLLSDARLAGLVDWDAIEDRLRKPVKPLHFDDLEELVANALGWYRLDRWLDQSDYVELWVEKDALAGVLEPLAQEFHVTLMVNRGYSSQSAMYESAERFRDASSKGKFSTLLYLGDHDPSGEDMVRDIRARFETFGVEVDVQKIALTMAQVRQYNPPPNPAKMSDSRAGAYVEKHGRSSWEVDALPPEVLARLVRDSIAAIVDDEALEAIKAREEDDKAALRKAVAQVRKRKTGSNGAK